MDHRRQQHRLVKIGLGAGNRHGSGIRRGVVDQLWHAVPGDPAGDPLAERRPQLICRLVRVLADLAQHRHGHEVAFVDAVDAHVVVVDQLAELRGDGVTDLPYLGEPRQAGSETLDRLQLGGPGGHSPERARRPNGHRRVAREPLGSVQVHLAPVVWAIVPEVQDPVQIVAVDERRDQQGVDPLLHRGGAKRARGPHRVGPGRHERPAGRNVVRHRARDLDLAGAGQEVLGEPRSHGRRYAAVRIPQDDGDTVGAEQHPRMVTQVAGNLADIQSGGEVGGHPAQRLGSSKTARRLFGGAGATNEDAKRTGDGVRKATAVVRSELDGTGQHQHAPRRVAAGDGDRQLVGAHPEDGERTRCPGACMHGFRSLERHRDHVGAGRDRSRGPRSRALRRRGASDEAAGPVLPDADERSSRHQPDPLARLVQRRVQAAWHRRDLGEIGEQVKPGRTLGQRCRDRASVPRRAKAGRCRFGGDLRAGRGRGQEPLEVGLAIPPVAALVDPVVAEPSGVAPGAHGVCMHAEDARRLGHGQRRVPRPRRPGAGRIGVGFGKHGHQHRILLASQELTIGHCSHDAADVERVRSPPGVAPLAGRRRRAPVSRSCQGSCRSRRGPPVART